MDLFIPKTVPDLLLRRAGSSPNGVAGYQRIQGHWQATTWSALLDEVLRAATGLLRLGLRKGDRLAILARTCREWQVAELAALHIGAVVVGIDPHLAPDQCAAQLREAAPAGLVIDSRANLAKIPADVRRRLRALVVMEGAPGNDCVSWPDLLAHKPTVPPLPGTPGRGAGREGRSNQGHDGPSPHPQPLFPEYRGEGRPCYRFNRAHAGPAADDPATLCFTSGTTGAPRAIEYTHAQLLAAVRSLRQAFPHIGCEDSLVCWLPLAHLYQRTMNLVAVAGGIPVYFVEDPRQIVEHLQEVSPTLFVAVPRFYEKVYQGMQERLAKLPRWQRRLADAALAAGAAMSRCVRGGEAPTWGLRVRHAVLDFLVLRRLRRVLGRRMRLLMTGSAPAAPWLLEFFHSIGLLVLEAYGVSENTVPLAVNRPYAFRFGSVGRSLPDNELRFAADGEILVRGPGVFSSHRSEEQFTEDGFYRTGDIGRLDEDGYLHLLGRKKELIKLSTGRRIDPARIEAVYRQSPYVDQVVVFGDGRAHLVALVAAVPGSGKATLAAEFERLGKELAPYERVVDFAILAEPLSVARGELTPTLKVRRDRVAARQHHVLNRLFASEIANTVLPSGGMRCQPC